VFFFFLITYIGNTLILLMPAKIRNNKGKRGRPSKATQVKIRNECLEEYTQYHTAAYAARILHHDPATVEKYYRGFQETQLEETNAEFVLKQRSAKDRVLTKLDEVIEDLNKQLVRLYTELKKNTQEVDKARYESMVTTTLRSKSDLLQQKAAIEATPTLDITFEKLLVEKYGSSIKVDIRPSKPITR